MISLILVILGNESYSGNVFVGSSSSSRVPSRPPGGVEEGLSNITEEEVGATSGVNIEVRVHPEPPLLPTILHSVSFFSF